MRTPVCKERVDIKLLFYLNFFLIYLEINKPKVSVQLRMEGLPVHKLFKCNEKLKIECKNIF